MTTKYVIGNSSTRWECIQYDGTNTSDVLTAINATQPNGFSGNGFPGGVGYFDQDGSGNLTVVASTLQYASLNPVMIIPGAALTVQVPTDYWVIWISDGTQSQIATCVSDTDFAGAFLALA